MAERVTRQQVEVAAQGSKTGRVTQQYAEILSKGPTIFFPTAETTLTMDQGISKFLIGDIYVTRQQIEIANAGHNGVARVTQQYAEILYERVFTVNPPLAYATLEEGEDYFAARLHAQGWPCATVDNRRKALHMATLLIDTLNFKDQKHTVYELLQEEAPDYDVDTALDNEWITKEQLQAANLAQSFEFPRGADTDIPQAIKVACLEIAESLLDGKDPALELEQLAVFNHLAYSFSAAHERRYVPIEHLINMIPSSLAWSWLKPFLVDEEAIKITRIN